MKSETNTQSDSAVELVKDVIRAAIISSQPHTVDNVAAAVASGAFTQKEMDELMQFLNDSKREWKREQLQAACTKWLMGETNDMQKDIGKITSMNKKSPAIVGGMASLQQALDQHQISALKQAEAEEKMRYVYEQHRNASQNYDNQPGWYDATTKSYK